MRHFVQNRQRKGIPIPAGLHKGNPIRPFSKVHFCFKVFCLAQHPVGNIPTACPAHKAPAVPAAAFQALIRCNEHVPGLSRPAIAPSEQFPVYDQSTSDSGAD